jgi:hypothetical protein
MYRGTRIRTARTERRPKPRDPRPQRWCQGHRRAPALDARREARSARCVGVQRETRAAHRRRRHSSWEWGTQARGGRDPREVQRPAPLTISVTRAFPSRRARVYHGGARTEYGLPRWGGCGGMAPRRRQALRSTRPRPMARGDGPDNPRPIRSPATSVRAGNRPAARLRRVGDAHHLRVTIRRSFVALTRWASSEH